VGDQIFLKGSNLLPAGVYTLLPARYALLPGAMLVTPDAVTPVGTQVKPDGAALASGYRFNGLNPAVDQHCLPAVRDRAAAGHSGAL
jgi:filamentous hemagglutinin